MKKLAVLTAITLISGIGFFSTGKAYVDKNTQTEKLLEITSPIDVTIDTEYLEGFFESVLESSEGIRPAYE